MSELEIGCCGAYCAACREYQKTCKGCKVGYDDGSRDLTKAKCAMKVCCVSKGYACCALCEDFDGCAVINTFHAKTSYKYKKYREASLFIKENGVSEFLALADNWTNAHGKLQKK